jgi:hypothetical protein
MTNQTLGVKIIYWDHHLHRQQHPPSLVLGVRQHPPSPSSRSSGIYTPQLTMIPRAAIRACSLHRPPLPVRRPLQRPLLNTLSPQQPLSRSFHPRTPSLARYGRSPSSSSSSSSSSSPGWEAPPPPPPGRGERLYAHPIVQLLRHRLGGDRGLLIFGVGGSGCIIYYLAQFVSQSFPMSAG